MPEWIEALLNVTFGFLAIGVIGVMCGTFLVCMGLPPALAYILVTSL